MLFRTLLHGVGLWRTIPSTSSTDLGRTIEEMSWKHAKLQELKKKEGDLRKRKKEMKVGDA